MSVKGVGRFLNGSVRSCGGRNSTGRITIRHRGGRTLRRYPIINRRRRLLHVVGEVIALTRSSLRTGPVAAVRYPEYGLYEHLLAPHGLGVRSQVVAFSSPPLPTSPLWVRLAKRLTNVGNSFMLQFAKMGSMVSNIELRPGQGGRVARAAGTSARIIQKITVGVGRVYVALRLRSGGLLYVEGRCWATLGQTGNPLHHKRVLGTAGHRRTLGFRSCVRGVAMNPIDHPHGGGEGKTSGGRSSVSPWGRLAKGKRTIKPYRLRRRKRFLMRLQIGWGA